MQPEEEGMCYLVAIPHYLLDEALPFLFRLLRSCFRLHLRCEVSTPRLNLHRTGLFKRLGAFILWCAWSGLDHLTQKMRWRVDGLLWVLPTGWSVYTLRKRCLFTMWWIKQEAKRESCSARRCAVIYALGLWSPKLRIAKHEETSSWWGITTFGCITQYNRRPKYGDPQRMLRQYIHPLGSKI